MAKATRGYIKHHSGGIYAAEMLGDGTIITICGPLHYMDHDGEHAVERLDWYNYESNEDVEWAQAEDAANLWTAYDPKLITDWVDGWKPPLLGAETMGSRLGIKTWQVRKLAMRHGIGQPVDGKMWVFQVSDEARFRAVMRRVGRPRQKKEVTE